MTFKGCEYQTILDMERCLFVAQAEEKVLELQLKTYRLQREKKALIEDTEVRLNIQRNFISELDKLITDLVDKIDRISEDMNDLEALIFTSKFVKGMTNTQIINDLYISEAHFYRYIDSISKKLQNTEGEELKIALTE